MNIVEYMLLVSLFVLVFFQMNSISKIKKQVDNNYIQLLKKQNKQDNKEHDNKEME